MDGRKFKQLVGKEMRLIRKVSVVLIILLLLISTYYGNSASASIAQRPVICNYIIFDTETNLSQMSFEIYEEGWILNWSKYELYVSISRQDIISNRVEIPSTIGTLAFGETHYLNSSKAITKYMINKTAYIKINKTNSDKVILTRSVTVTPGKIVHNYTTVDDYDSGKEIEDWYDRKSIFLLEDPLLFICIVAFLSIMLVAITLYYARKSYGVFIDKIYYPNIIGILMFIVGLIDLAVYFSFVFRIVIENNEVYFLCVPAWLIPILIFISSIAALYKKGYNYVPIVSFLSFLFNGWIVFIFIANGLAPSNVMLLTMLSLASIFSFISFVLALASESEFKSKNLFFWKK